jgi:hypothetical protein
LSRDEGIAQEVRALAALGLEPLREEWRRRWGAPPKLRSPELLRYLIAWRIQTAAFGGLDVQTRRRLRGASQPGPEAALTRGVKLVREWQGAKVEVEVVDGGFRYRGETYRSLSKIAQVVTGTKWNGPRFFGLRSDEAA